MGEQEEQAAEKTYRAIGRFMFEFSQVEYAIRHCLAEEIRLNENYFAAVMESHDVSMLVAIAIDVYKKSRGEDAEQIQKLLNRFRGINDLRKRVAHGLWVPFKDGGTVHYVARSKLSPSQFSEQAKELEEHADELCQLRADLEREFSAIPELIRRKR
jgi:hypothetical protein